MTDLKPSGKKTITPAQIERGLTDAEWPVRRVWAQRTDYTPTPAQIERGLTDADGCVRDAWAERSTRRP